MSDASFRLTAHLVDVLNERVLPADITVTEGRIAAVDPASSEPTTYACPGFVDAHVHVESSLLVPSEFGRAAALHGTVATVSDPHEIANVVGIAGVRYMLDSAAQTLVKIHFGAPSCVPATMFETAGACLDVEDVAKLLDDPHIGYLSEMMNYPGVIHDDPIVLGKIRAAQDRGKPIDGHAPCVRGADAKKYFAAGISTDHECVSIDEAREKLALGVKILIREGSAARNFEALCGIIPDHWKQCMFCTDDMHPDLLIGGHIDRHVRRAVAKGFEVMKVLRMACVNPVEHYRMNVGLLRVGDPADFIELADLRDFRVLRTYIDGHLVAEANQPRMPSVPISAINQFVKTVHPPADFAIPSKGARVLVIEAIDGELITRRVIESARIENGHAIADPARDLLKIAVVNRYRSEKPAVAFVKGIGLRRGAIASSVAHDSHNIVAVGVDDASLAAAVNAVMDSGGGLAVFDGKAVDILPLPVAGLMSTEPFENVAAAYSRIDRLAKELGTPLRAPFMTLSFLALLVIPELKLSDRGLFDCARMGFTEVFP